MQSNHPDQHALFADGIFAERLPVARLNFDRYRARMKRGMADALKEHGAPREAIAAQISASLGCSMTKTMLDTYVSEAKTADISLAKFKALVRTTGAVSLWDLAARDEGLLMLAGSEARLAEIGRLQQKQRQIARQIRALALRPVPEREGE